MTEKGEEMGGGESGRRALKIIRLNETHVQMSELYKCRQQEKHAICILTYSRIKSGNLG